MSTLLLRFAAPIQSWGLESKFERRLTAREPTKSGVIGMLAGALGRRRDESLEDLAALRFGVRLDQPGQLLKDFHTAEFKKDAPPYITERYYLADAIFLVGLEGSEELLRQLEEALCAPAFPIYLGRRSCPPAGRIVIGIRNKPLTDALSDEPWQASLHYRKNHKNEYLTMVLDSESGMIRRRDRPVSFSQEHRKYAFRSIDDIVHAVEVKTIAETEHNPLKALDLMQGGKVSEEI